jgi:NADH pyrophosphatase NudC (nudix superfamily)
MSRREYRYCPIFRSDLVTRELGGRARRACPREDCGFVAWDNPIPVVAAIVERAGEIVLVRSRGAPENWYGLVAGFLEAGESPEAGMLREVREELGIDARSPKFIGTYSFARMNQIIFVYHVDAGGGEIRLCERELAGYKSIPLERVRPWSQGTGPGLRDWLATRGLYPPVVEFGEHVD